MADEAHLEADAAADRRIPAVGDGCVRPGDEEVVVVRVRERADGEREARAADVARLLGSVRAHVEVVAEEAPVSACVTEKLKIVPPFRTLHWPKG